MLVLVSCAASAWLYGKGLQALWRHAGRDRGIKTWRATCFGMGLVAILLALQSPLDTMAVELFSAHMVQHLVLLLVAAPLLVLGQPLVPLAWAIPEPSRTRLSIFRRLHSPHVPALAFVLHSAALWLWHVPILYDLAISNPLVHIAEHASFVGTAALFWWGLLSSGRVGYGVGVLYVFGMALQSTLLGALLTFAGKPWFASHLSTTAAWGLSPLEDQQLAGLIMWIPGGSIYLACALGLFSAWLKASGTPDPAPGTPARR